MEEREADADLNEIQLFGVSKANEEPKLPRGLFLRLSEGLAFRALRSFFQDGTSLYKSLEVLKF